MSAVVFSRNEKRRELIEGTCRENTKKYIKIFNCKKVKARKKKHCKFRLKVKRTLKRIY